MIDLFKEAAALQLILENEGRDFFFVGGIALQIWGQPRLTTDIDLTVFTDLTDETADVKHFLTFYRSRFETEEDAIEFAQTNRVLLLETPSKTGIDLMLSALPDISTELQRSSYQKFTPDISLKVCSADNLITYKTIAGRLQDLADLESVITKQKNLDWDYINEYLLRINEYKDISASITKLHEIKNQAYKP